MQIQPIQNTYGTPVAIARVNQNQEGLATLEAVTESASRSILPGSGSRGSQPGTVSPSFSSRRPSEPASGNETPRRQRKRSRLDLDRTLTNEQVDDVSGETVNVPMARYQELLEKEKKYEALKSGFKDFKDLYEKQIL